MMYIELYAFWGTMICGMELKSNFSEGSDALVSARTTGISSQDDFIENKVSKPDDIT